MAVSTFNIDKGASDFIRGAFVYDHTAMFQIEK